MALPLPVDSKFLETPALVGYLFLSYIPTQWALGPTSIQSSPEMLSVSFLTIPLFTHQSKTTDSQLSEMVYRKSAQRQKDDLNDHLGSSYFLTKQ